MNATDITEDHCEHTECTSGEHSTKATQAITRSRRQLRRGVKARAGNGRQRAKILHAVTSTMRKSSHELVMSRSEFEDCRRRLTRAFRTCTDVEFVALTTILTLLLHSFRPLYVPEVTAVVNALDERSDRGDGYITELDLKGLMSKCDKLVSVDPMGNLEIQSHALRRFLIAYQIAGIDRSQKTIAKACLLQLEQDMQRQRSTLSVASKPGPFAKYAAWYWEAHYRCAESLSLGLTLRVHRLLWSSCPLETLSHGGTDVPPPIPHINCITEAIDFCRRRKLRVLQQLYVQLREAGGSEFDDGLTMVSSKAAASSTQSAPSQSTTALTASVEVERSLSQEVRYSYITKNGQGQNDRGIPHDCVQDKSTPLKQVPNGADDTIVRKAETTRNVRQQTPRKTMFCQFCDDQPQDFQGDHKLRRHIAQHNITTSSERGANCNVTAYQGRGHFNPHRSKQGGCAMNVENSDTNVEDVQDAFDCLQIDQSDTDQESWVIV